MKKKTNIIELTFLFAWPYILVVSTVLYLITGNWDFVLSFVLGTFSSLMMNSMQYRIMKQAFATAPNTIRSKTVMLYIAKMVFYAIILYFTVNNPEWNIYFVAGGIMTYRVVLWIITIIQTLRKAGDVNGTGV